MSPDPRIGSIVAGHRLLEVIGRGGMSVVYLAEHLELERHVALKILGPELAEDEAFRERFIRESRVAAELDHPNVVTVFDAGEADGSLYLSMRYVEGSDLERLLRSATVLDPGTTVDLISQCAAGLDAAHARGLVHRDVKPGNVLLTPDAGAYHAFLSDFGVTKRIHTGASLTRSGQFVGTVDYVAPEQIRSDEVDARADVYSLACVAFRCLTGDVPFPRDTEVATIYAQLQDPPPVPSERRPGLPRGFDAPILRALAKARDERFDSCGAFANAVAGVVSVSAPLVARASRAPGGRTRRGRRGLLVGVAVGVVAVLVATALLWPRQGGTSAEGPSPPPPLPELTWRGTVLPTGDAAGAASAVADVAGGPVVAGWVADAGDRDAAVWTPIADGSWERVRDPEFGGNADQRISALAADGALIVAVGSESARDDTDAAVWRSDDGGSSWARIDPVTGGLHRPADQAMLTVIRAPEGWLAAGWDRSGGDQDAALWTSDDGATWTQQRIEPFGGTGRQAITAIAAAGERIVAAGWTSGPDGDLDGAVWVRTGDRWARVDDAALGGPGDQELWAVASEGTTIVAAGGETTSAEPHAAIWTSHEGGTWERASGDGLAEDIAGGIRSLAALDGAWVAGGWTQTPGTPSPAVWRSVDGSTWGLGAPGDGSPTGIDGGGGGAIAALIEPGPERMVAAGSQAPASAVAWIADVG